MILKVKKNGVFLFGISFFRFRDIYVFVFINEESHDAIGGSIKTVQYSIKNISRNIKQCSLNLAPEMSIT